MEKYELVKEIGSGNFGVARLMRVKDSKELVAMKYIERGPKVSPFCFFPELLSCDFRDGQNTNFEYSNLCICLVQNCYICFVFQVQILNLFLFFFFLGVCRSMRTWLERLLTTDHFAIPILSGLRRYVHFLHFDGLFKAMLKIEKSQLKCASSHLSQVHYVVG